MRCLGFDPMTCTNTDVNSLAKCFQQLFSALTSEVEATVCGHREGVTGLSAASLLLVHCHRETTTFGLELHRVPLAVVQSRA